MVPKWRACVSGAPRGVGGSASRAAAAGPAGGLSRAVAPARLAAAPPPRRVGGAHPGGGVPTPGGGVPTPGGSARMMCTRRAADPGGGCSRPGGWAARRAGGLPVGCATYARAPLCDRRFLPSPLLCRRSPSSTAIILEPIVTFSLSCIRDGARFFLARYLRRATRVRPCRVLARSACRLCDLACVVSRV